MLLGDPLTNRTDRTLLAVLLNPPQTTSGVRTRRAVERAGRVLGYDGVTIVNLCPENTRSVVELNGTALTEHGLATARDEIRDNLRSASGLLGAWGVSGLSGPARRAREEQVSWLYAQAWESGVTHAWMVGGQPRHPSRWHQYVSDRYRRTPGGGFAERLQSVLVAVPIQLRE